MTNSTLQKMFFSWVDKCIRVSSGCDLGRLTAGNLSRAHIVGVLCCALYMCLVRSIYSSAIIASRIEQTMKVTVYEVVRSHIARQICARCLSSWRQQCRQQPGEMSCPRCYFLFSFSSLHPIPLHNKWKNLARWHVDHVGFHLPLSDMFFAVRAWTPTKLSTQESSTILMYIATLQTLSPYSL